MCCVLKIFSKGTGVLDVKAGEEKKINFQDSIIKPNFNLTTTKLNIID